MAELTAHVTLYGALTRTPIAYLKGAVYDIENAFIKIPYSARWFDWSEEVFQYCYGRAIINKNSIGLP